MCIEKGPLLKNCISYNNGFKSILKNHEQSLIKNFKELEIYERTQYFLSNINKKIELEGEKRLKKFEDLLFNKFKYKPHKFQKGFLEKTVIGLAELLVGKKEWLQIGPELMKQRGWSESNISSR